MDAVNKLLDKAKEVRSMRSDVALAVTLGVSRQLVSQWRKGANPLSDERIAQISDVAREDAATWLVIIHAEQATGAAGKAWTRLARQLGAAASLAAMTLCVLPSVANARPALISAVELPANAYYVNSPMASQCVAARLSTLPRRGSYNVAIIDLGVRVAVEWKMELSPTRLRGIARYVRVTGRANRPPPCN